MRPWCAFDVEGLVWLARVVGIDHYPFYMGQGTANNRKKMMNV